jgi:P-type Mg2+ transporter
VTRPSQPRSASWIGWLVGAAAVLAVIGAAVHRSEARDFAALAQRAHPSWLLLALALQAATYAAQGQIWRVVSRAAGVPLSPLAAYKLSLAELFVDQALPSAGISGTLLVAGSLERRGMPRPAVHAGVLLRLASYYVAYALALGTALLAARVSLLLDAWVALGSVLFVGFATALAAIALALPGRAPHGLLRRAASFPALARPLRILTDADPGLVRSPWLLFQACACHLAILGLDAATLRVLIEALGAHVPAVGLFASFMISTLFRTIGILPGGLGSFEAASVLTLHMIGLEIPVALAATLLFRGASFWLPMLPGMWFSRYALAPAASRGAPEPPAA